eukprot:Hpha_TRINITY_DN15535_c0_g1::TRINITY_DN15535_c0_g1_i1::g.109083::m.109083
MSSPNVHRQAPATPGVALASSANSQTDYLMAADTPVPGSPSGKSHASRKSVQSHAESTTTQKEWKGMHKASLFSCIVNLANSIIGAGILGLPHGIKECGLVLGIIVMTTCCCLSTFSLHLLAQCGHFFHQRGQPSSFYAVAVEAIPRWSIITDIAVVVNCFANGATYLIVVGDLMPDVMDFMGAGGVAQNRRLWVLVAFAVVTPLSCLPRLDSLRYTSSMSMIFIAFVTVMVVLYKIAPEGMDPCEHLDGSLSGGCVEDRKLFNWASECLKAITVFIFCFTCQQNMFTVCNEISDPSPRRYDLSIFGSQGFALLVYLVVSVCSYYTYGDRIDSDMLKSYPVTAVVSVARICIALLVCFAYPLQAHPSRRSALSLWEQYREWQRGKKVAASTEDDCEDNNNDADDDDSVIAEATKLFRYWTVTILFLTASLAVALAVSDLGVALAISGGTASTLVCYIVPGICYYNIYPEPHLKRTFAFAMFCLGLVIMPASILITFLA